MLKIKIQQLTIYFVSIVIIINYCAISEALNISSNKNKFSFRKTFKTPQESYDEEVAKLDNCEILERSNFSSEEEDREIKPGKKSKRNGPIANAEIHVRFGVDPETPTERNEKYIEIPKTNTGCCYHCPNFHPPFYYQHGPYGNYHFPPQNYFNPCNYQNTEGCNCKKNPHCGASGTSTPTKPNEQVPFVYFYEKDICGHTPTHEQIKQQPTEVLTCDHLALINGGKIDCPKKAKTEHSTKPGEVVLTQIISAPPCENNPRDCLDLSDKLTYVKVKISDITNKPWNCRCKQSVKCYGRLNVDVDDLVKIGECFEDDPYESGPPWYDITGKRANCGC